MQAEKIEKNLNALEEKLKEKIQVMGPSRAAKITGWHKQNMCAFSKGRLKPSWNNIIKLAKLFGL